MAEQVPRKPSSPSSPHQPSRHFWFCCRGFSASQVPSTAFPSALQALVLLAPAQPTRHACLCAYGALTAESGV